MSSDEKKVHRGVFLLPNALTTGALFAGFYSIIAGINGHFIAGAVAVVVAAVLDGLDGRVARLTNTQSDFGVEYDSLSDLISFGLAPALLAFNWSLASLRELGPLAGKLGWLAAFLFVACGALRLARFNTQAGTVSGDHFVGLPIPGAAGPESRPAEGGSLASDDSGILAGQWMPYLEQAFKEFASGERPMVKKMKPKVEKLEPADIEALVNYYGSFK